MRDDTAFFEKPGYKAQYRFLNACRRAMADRIAGKRKANEHFQLRQAAIVVHKRVVVSANNQEMYEKSRKLSLEGYRRVMRGEHEDEVKAENSNERKILKDKSDKAKVVVDQLAEQEESRYLDNLLETTKAFNDMYEDTVGYHQWVLRKAREEDRRAAEWEDDPIIPA